jgi:uncharacterized protein DUF6011
MTTPKCQICSRQLENSDSINRGIGPECLAKREKFLAAAGSNDHEIAELALSNDPRVARWIAMAGRAIGAGRQDHVNRFIAAARAAKKVIDRRLLMAIRENRTCLNLLNGTIAVEEKRLETVEPSAFDLAYIKELYNRRERLEASLAAQEAGVDPDYEAAWADHQAAA